MKNSNLFLMIVLAFTTLQVNCYSQIEIKNQLRYYKIGTDPVMELSCPSLLLKEPKFINNYLLILEKTGDSIRIESKTDTTFFIRFHIPSDKKYIGPQILVLLDSLGRRISTCSLLIRFNDHRLDLYPSQNDIYFNEVIPLIITGENLLSIERIEGIKWGLSNVIFETFILSKPIINDSVINTSISVTIDTITSKGHLSACQKIKLKVFFHDPEMNDAIVSKEYELPISFKVRESPLLKFNPSDLVIEDIKAPGFTIELSFSSASLTNKEYVISSQGLIRQERAWFIVDLLNKKLVSRVFVNNNVSPGKFYIKISDTDPKTTPVAEGEITIKPTPDITSIKLIGVSDSSAKPIPEINPFLGDFTFALTGNGLDDPNIGFKILQNEKDQYFTIDAGYVESIPRTLNISMKPKWITCENDHDSVSVPNAPFGQYSFYLTRKRGQNTITYKKLTVGTFKLVEPLKVYPDISSFVKIENVMTRQDCVRIVRKANRIEELNKKIEKHSNSLTKAAIPTMESLNTQLIAKIITAQEYKEKIEDREKTCKTDSTNNCRIKQWNKRIVRIKRQISSIETFYLANVKSPPDLAIDFNGNNVPPKYGSQYMRIKASIYKPEKKTNALLESINYPDPQYKTNFIIASSEPKFSKSTVKEKWESGNGTFFDPDNIAPFNKITFEVTHAPDIYKDKSESIPLIKNYYVKGNFFDHLGITITLPPLLLLGAVTKDEETGECKMNFQVSTLNVGIGIKYIFRNRHNWLPTGHSAGIYFMGMNFGQVHSDSTLALVGEKVIGQGTFTMVGFYELNLLSIEQGVKIPIQFGIGFTPNALNNKPLLSAMLGIGINIPIIK